MDIFAQIARNGAGGRRDQLCQHEPPPLPSCRTTLEQAAAAPLPLPAKIKTESELRGALQGLRGQYAPFLRSLAPALPTVRHTQTLREFRYKSSPAAAWQAVTIPHYAGPLGPALTIYETTFAVQPAEPGKAVFVTVNGADYKARVLVNGRLAGCHEGFFASFSFEITSLLRTGENTLTIEVENDYVMMGSRTEQDPQKICGDKLYAATGPGYDDPALGWHHCPPGTGLLDTVTIETRSALAIEQVFARTLPADGANGDEIEFWIEVNSTRYEPAEVSFLASVYGQNLTQTVVEDLRFTPGTAKELGLGDTFTEVNARRDGTLNAALPTPCAKGTNRFKLRLPAGALCWWTPTAPWLYQLQLRLVDAAGNLLDTYCQNFARRTFAQDTAGDPKGMFSLNGTPIRLRGANTMGFEQQDIMRGDPEQLIEDILLAKLCNMNFWRITQRPVQQAVYELCDRLGLLVQTDLPLFGCLRRRQFCEAVRQAEEMERHIRRHPSCVLVSYINEPFPNANNLPNQNLERAELEQFFTAADIAVRLNNPDRVIKHVDGDYDPPSATLPDNHCYCMWYNGHGMDIGQLYKGYWLPVRPGWYYSCGEFGCEGLESWELMQAAYPAEWLPQPGEPESAWEPSRIVGAQTGDFYHFFYDQQSTPQQWVAASQQYQAFATQMMTEAFRRDDRMVSFALHLFIDAFPSGWMKTIMDCRRTPKPAYFAYRNALEPILVSLRADKTRFFAGETANTEIWLCNDTQRAGPCTLRYELLCGDTVCSYGEKQTELTPNRAFCCDIAGFALPPVTARTVFTLRAALFEGDACITWNALPYTVFPRCGGAQAGLQVKPISEITAADLKAAAGGAVLFAECLQPGTYPVGEEFITVQESGMAPLQYASAKTGHAWVQGFAPDDFRLWYSSDLQAIAPLAECTVAADAFTPVLTSRNLDKAGRWQPVSVLCEKKYGAGRVVLSAISYRMMLQNPAGELLLGRIEK